VVWFAAGKRRIGLNTIGKVAVNGIDFFVDTYGRLEKEVQDCMTQHCAGRCSRCAQRCCRPHFCREALESPFLIQVRIRFAPEVPWYEDRGWLGAEGCRLSAGRPPVCYEFLCDPLIAGLGTSRQRKTLGRLAMLLTTAGKSARGRRHLVELSDLDRLNHERLARQLAQARAELGDLRQMLSDD